MSDSIMRVIPVSALPTGKTVNYLYLFIHVLLHVFYRFIVTYYDTVYYLFIYFDKSRDPIGTVFFNN